MKDLVSIIIPMYNSELNIKSLIDSIKKQTYENFEVLFIDDFSKDSTVKLCKEAISEDKRFKIFLNKENCGVSVSRNIGINNCNGKYIIFIDSDDKIYENTVEFLVQKINQNNADLVIGNYKYNNGTENKILENKISEDIYDIQVNILLDNKESRANFGNPRSVWGKIYKSDIIKNNNIRFIPNLKLFEDALFNLEYMMYCKKYCVYNDYIYIYSINNNSAVHKYYEDLYNQDEIRVKKLCEFLEKSQKKFDYEEAKSILIFEFFCGYLINLSKSKKNFFKELKEKINNSVYTEYLKKVNKNKLSRNHLIIYNLLKLRLYFIIYLLCKLK